MIFEVRYIIINEDKGDVRRILSSGTEIDMKDNVLLIGVAGGTGSGKTTLVGKLAEHFGESVCVVCHDWYYRARGELSLAERARQNYDCPEAFETDRLVRDLCELKAGRAVDCPQYDYSVHDRSPLTRHLEPARVIIVEGILIFADSALRELMDIRIFVDTDADIRILRRLRRDVKERGRSVDSVFEQYVATVKPMHEAYVEPSKKYAHLIVPEGGENRVALEMILGRVKSHLIPNL